MIPRQVNEVSRIYRFGTRGLRGLLRAFFRRVELTGLGNVPDTAGGILIAWHPNALVDGALILGSRNSILGSGALPR